MWQLDDREDLIFAPKWFEFGVRMLIRLLAIVTLFLFIILTFVVCRYSPRMMSTYRWYLLLNAAYCCLMDLLLVFWAPELLLFHEKVVISHCLIKWNQYNVIAALISALIATISLVGTVYTTAWLFLFRFLQTTNHPWLNQIIQARNYLYCYLMLCVSIAVSILYPLSLNLIIDKNTASLLFQAYPEAYNRIITSDFAIGLTSDTDSRYRARIAQISIAIHLAVAFSVIIYCALHSYQFVNSMESQRLSSRTVRMNRTLLRALFIELLVTHLSAAFGFATVFICYNFTITHSPSLMLCVTMVLSVYGFLSTITIILTLPPYYEGAKVLFNRLFAILRHQTPSTPVRSLSFVHK